MRKGKIRIIGFLLMFFVLAVTPACEAFWELMETEQVDNNDNNNNNNNNTDQSNSSKGKR